ncbi:MAG: cytochrome c [Terriglobales bacterium]
MKTRSTRIQFDLLVRFPLPCIMTIILCLSFAQRLALAQNEGAATQRPRQSVYAPLLKVPIAARARENPFEGNPLDATAGGKLYSQHCADCHGPKAGGTRNGPSLLREEVQHATPGTIFWILTNGVVWHGMPVWSKLPEPERWQIVTFLESLHPQSGRPANAP